MKRVIISFIILLYFTQIQCQCPAVPLVFSTQEEIDSFPINYPDCRNLEVDLSLNVFYQNLTSVKAFDQLESIDGTLEFFFCDELIDIDGFNNLEYISEDLRIEYCEKLTTISGFSSLKGVNAIRLRNNAVLEEYNLPELEEPLSSLSISSDSGLKLNINSHVSLESFGASGIVDFNLNSSPIVGLESVFISNLTGNANFNSLSTIIPDTIKQIFVSDYSNLDLKGLSSFSQLENLNINDIDSLSITENPILNQPLNLYLIRINGLADLTGFSGLNLKELRILRLDDFESLNGLESLTTLELIDIQSCPKIESIYQLEDASNLRRVTLFNNENLTFCNVSPVCQLIEDNSPDVIIRMNLSTCEDIDSVAVECLKSSTLDEISTEDEPNFYPNPTKRFINVKESHLFKNCTLEIFNINGKKIKTTQQLNSQIDLSYLPSGQYLFKSQCNDGIKSELIILNN